MISKYSFRLGNFLLFGLLLLLPSAARAQATMDAASQKKIDDVVNQTLASTGVPGASLAIVSGGRIVYAQAYGYSNLETKTSARPEMRYSIGSISKQFTATALLMLAEQGKLSLADPVSKFEPNLTRGNEVTVRQLLSMTSGYQDYWPQDYVMPMMLKPVTAQQIIVQWARIPLDFEPGTKWQYSNTNYVIAGLIVEKVSGMSLLDFLKKRIFVPLQMSSVTSMHISKDTPADPIGYLKYALGVPRTAPKEGKGWLFAAGELAMTASDLARWDISIVDRKLLKPDSYRQLETEVLLKNGVGTRYGLGIGVAMEQNRRALSHGGEVSGFVADNVIYPEDRAAVVVLTNLDASTGAEQIAKQVRPILFPDQDKNMEERQTLVRKIFSGLQLGQIDRSLFTANCNAYFSEQAIHDFATSLDPLGVPEEFTQASHSIRGGMGFRSYTARFKGGKSVRITMRDMPDGKIEQYQIMPSE
jgi:CubicO group peptidase (beta-lactamase class C family)